MVDLSGPGLTSLSWIYSYVSCQPVVGQPALLWDIGPQLRDKGTKCSPGFHAGLVFVAAGPGSKAESLLPSELRTGPSSFPPHSIDQSKLQG